MSKKYMKMKKNKINIPLEMKVAIKLFRQFEDRITKDEAKLIFLDLFNNFREKGFSLWHARTDHKVCFSEWRTGGAIVVYYGTYDQFDFITNHPKTDEIWEQRVFFDIDFTDFYGNTTVENTAESISNSYERAADFIKEWLFFEYSGRFPLKFS